MPKNLKKHEPLTKYRMEQAILRICAKAFMLDFVGNSVHINKHRAGFENILLLKHLLEVLLEMSVDYDVEQIGEGWLSSPA